MNIYKLGAQDAQAMADIHASCFDRGWSALDMAVHINKDMCLGMGDVLQAFIIMRVSDREAEVLTIATNVGARRQGYGRAVLTAAFKALTFKGVKSLFLEVAEDNEGAQKLYKACGFTPIGRRPAYYRRENGRVAAITFSKALDAAK